MIARKEGNLRESSGACTLGGSGDTGQEHQKALSESLILLLIAYCNRVKVVHCGWHGLNNGLLAQKVPPISIGGLYVTKIGAKPLCLTHNNNKKKQNIIIN